MHSTSKADKLTSRAAIERVLAESDKPMTVPEIIAAAVPLTSLDGKTPGQTIYSVPYADNRKPWRIVRRVGKGEFRLGPSK